VASAQAADYPTKPDKMDKLCEVIGESPNPSVPPKDRLWFKENCTCLPITGCGNPGSARLQSRIDATAKRLAAEKAAEGKRLAAERAAEEKRLAAEKAAREEQLARIHAAWPATSAERRAYRACLSTPGTSTCAEEQNALTAACGRLGAGEECAYPHLTDEMRERFPDLVE
jgi:hypothetical protein